MKKRLKEEQPDIGDEELEVSLSNLDYTAYALGNTKTVLNEILAKYGDSYRLFLTGSGNFRDQAATILPYKGNRDAKHKPKYYAEIKDYLLNVWHAELIEGREADDAIGCAQWAKRDKSTVIATIDKDLNGIPGWHYNFVKDELYDVSYIDANRFFFWQMLVGDTTDNIPGIKGIGPKTADKLLPYGADVPYLRDVVQQQYQKQYKDTWEAAYTEIAELLWIERVEGKKCPFLW